MLGTGNRNPVIRRRCCLVGGYQSCVRAHRRVAGTATIEPIPGTVGRSCVWHACLFRDYGEGERFCSFRFQGTGEAGFLVGFFFCPADGNFRKLGEGKVIGRRVAGIGSFLSRFLFAVCLIIADQHQGEGRGNPRVMDEMKRESPRSSPFAQLVVLLRISGGGRVAGLLVEFRRFWRWTVCEVDAVARKGDCVGVRAGRSLRRFGSSSAMRSRSRRSLLMKAS